MWLELDYSFLGWGEMKGCSENSNFKFGLSKKAKIT
jgi:hypothetical protein